MTRIAVFLTAGLLCVFALARAPGLGLIGVHDLPLEAQRTLLLIKAGGPFPYAKDGVVFGNYENLLPRQRRGYYHEYTVPTPRIKHRGARRIVAGGAASSSSEYYYTGNHYVTFMRIQE
ncbi:MAG: ribonuclease domain-containing protein [Burkholderiaceae bacterium]